MDLLAWTRWCDAFFELLDERFYTREWLNGEVWSGRIEIIASDDAAVLVTIKTYPTGALEVHGMAAAGNMDTIARQLIPEAEQWGRERGCIVAGIDSREGWSRVLKNQGYEVYQVAIRKELCA